MRRKIAWGPNRRFPIKAAGTEKPKETPKEAPREPEKPRIMRYIGDPKTVSITLPLPPSVNDQYVKFRKRGGGNGYALTEEAKAFDKAVKGAISQFLYQLQDFPAESCESVFEIHLRLLFPAVENPKWFERYVRGAHKGERKAVKRYKRIDSDNRIKFAQDKICAALAIPGDEQMFRVISEKGSSKNPRLEVTVTYLGEGDLFGDAAEALFSDGAANERPTN